MAELTGWIRLHRKTRGSTVWDLPPSHFKIFAACLLMANNKDRTWFNGQGEEMIPRGSFITSQDRLAAEARLSRKVVRRALRNLERTGSIRAQARAKRYTLITVVNFDAYQQASDGEGQQTGQVRAKRGPSKGHNVRMEEGKNGRNNLEGSALTMEHYLAHFSPEGQEVLRQTVSAIARTRKNGRVAASVLDGLASHLSRYPDQTVLEACQTYLDRDHAGQGKDERYLLGIVREEFKRTSQNGDGRGQSMQTRTEGQLRIERAAREMALEPQDR